MPRAVILTALPVEYLAVRNHLTNPQEEMHPQGTIYERGNFAANGQSWEVGIAEVGAGNAGAAVEAERAIAYFKPDILFFVGIAGGIKDVEIGDVVAATDVYGYELGKAEEQQFFTRPKAGKSAYALVQRAKSEARKGDWLQRLANSPTSQPRVFLAPIAAGEKVIASRQSDVFRFLRASYNDAIAVEMEGFGFLSAAFAYPDIKAIVIRGISDLIEGKNDDAIESEDVRQAKASHHASAFAFEILAKLKLSEGLEVEPKIVQNISGDYVAGDKVIGDKVMGNKTVQNNEGNAKGWQTVVEGGTPYVGEIHIYNASPERSSPPPQVSIPKPNTKETTMIDFAIITAIKIERLAVLKAFEIDEKEAREVKGSRTYWRKRLSLNDGKFYEIVVAQCSDVANLNAAILTNDVLHHWKPNAVIMVGIAATAQPSTKQNLGDLVVGREIYYYEMGKVTPQGKLPEPKQIPVDATLFNRIDALPNSDFLVLAERPDGTTKQPEIAIGVIASGDKVIADEAERDKIAAANRKILAIEMEGYGVIASTWQSFEQVRCLVIRGLCDYADSTKNDGWHAYAAAVAAGFTKYFLLDEPLPARNIAGEQGIGDEPGSNIDPQTVQSEKVDPVSSPNFFAYDDAWVGRDSLIRELSDLIRGNCRLLMLVGITGIGKTALGERLAVEVSDWLEHDWSHYYQENFDDEQQTADFASVAARWLEKWGELVTPDDRKDPQRLLHRLIKHLRENRYLVQMDSLENILQGNEEEGWSGFKDEWWIRFFESYLKADTCESCLILTSQDLPGQLQTVGTSSQNFWYCQPLSGLELTEQIILFEKIALEVKSNSINRTYLERIGKAYEGHPLALRVIAGEIKNKPFDGNVQAYWNKYGNEVEEVEKAISEAQEGISVGTDDKWQLDRFTKTLRRNVRSRLNKTFKRLQKDTKWAYIMLCETSVYRCAVPEDFWLSHLEDWDRDEDEQKTALDALRDRYLVEELIDSDNQCLLKQHNLIRSVSLECLKQL
jgi:nucleoside phosphorylase